MGNCNPDKVRVTYHRTVLGLPGLNLRQFLLILVWTRPNLEPNNKSFFFVFHDRSPYPLGQPRRQILRTHLVGKMMLLKVMVMTT